MRLRQDTADQVFRRIGAEQAARATRHFDQRIAILLEKLQLEGKFFSAEPGFDLNFRRALGFEVLCVVILVVVDRVRERHQQRTDPGRGQFGDG